MVKTQHFDSLREHHSELISRDIGVKKLFAKDVMIKPIILNADDATDKILKKLKKENINACIVVTKEKKFLGEISDKDIINFFLQQVKYEPLVKNLNIGYRRNFLYKTAKDMINEHKSFVREDTPINEVIKIIWKEGFEYIPVLSKGDIVVGVVTPSSIIKLLKDY